MPRFMDLSGSSPIGAAADVRAAIGTNEVSALHTSFKGKSDGALPTVGDEGIAVTPRGGASNYLRMIVKDGLLQAPGLSGIPGDRGTYWNQPLTGVKRIGATFKISADAADPNGVVTLVLWEYPIPTPYKAPNSPLHLSVSSTLWELTVWEGGDQTTDATTDSLDTGTFATPLAADWNPAVPGSGTLHRVEVAIVDDTAYITLPDGSSAVVTDPRIASIPANVACHELYRNATDSAHLAFQDIWADTETSGLGAVSASDAGRIAKREATDARDSMINDRPVFTQYAPATNEDLTIPSSFTDITGLPSITFTMPDDATDIEVQATLYLSITATARVLVCFKEGASTYGVASVADSSSFKGVVSYRGYRTGIFPGTTHTITLQHRVVSGSGAVLKLDAPNGYYATWRVTPVTLSE